MTREQHHLIRKFLVLLVLGISLFGCKRFDRTYVPAEQKFLGLINKDQFKVKAYRNQIFDHTPAPRYDDENTYQEKDRLVPKRYRSKMFENTYGARYEGKDQSYEEGFQAGCQTFNSLLGSGLSRVKGSHVDADKLCVTVCR